jgi:alpha-N-acetylglucosamine transferase
MEQKSILSSQIMLLQPSRFEFQRIQDAVLHKKRKEFDMEIMNNLYNNSAMILPHRQYDLLSGEFRNTNHEAFLGSTEEVWDPEKALREAKFVHFSDWPYPKPWILPSEEKTLARRPNCTAVPTGSKKDCRAQEIWLRLYSDFRKRREVSHAYCCSLPHAFFDFPVSIS